MRMWYVKGWSFEEVARRTRRIKSKKWSFAGGEKKKARWWFCLCCKKHDSEFFTKKWNKTSFSFRFAVYVREIKDTCVGMGACLSLIRGSYYFSEKEKKRRKTDNHILCFFFVMAYWLVQNGRVMVPSPRVSWKCVLHVVGKIFASCPMYSHLSAREKK